MNLFQIVDVCCTDEILDLIGIVKFILSLVQWIIPVVLIVLITIDMFKAMTSGDEKAVKAAQKQAISRLIYAVIVFLIPFIIRLVFSLIGSLDVENNDSKNISTSFWKCYNEGVSTGDACKEETATEE